MKTVADQKAYYRRHSVPKKGSTATSIRNSTPRPAPPPSQQARPPANSNYNRPNPQQQAYRPPSSPHQHRPPPPTTQYRPSPPTNHYRPPPAPAPPRARPPSTPTPAPAPPKAKTPPPPVPTIMGLVALPNSYLSSLSIGTLKAILYENHVKVDFKQVLEKYVPPLSRIRIMLINRQELIGRVAELITAERKRLERQRYEEERLAQGESAPTSGGEDTHAHVTDKTQIPTGPMPEIERGLCVVCQDEEATLAVVDCGYVTS